MEMWRGTVGCQVETRRQLGRTRSVKEQLRRADFTSVIPVAHRQIDEAGRQR